MQVNRALTLRRADALASTTNQEHAMNKLRLNLDDLTVDTFQTGDDVSLRGTVQGQEESGLVCPAVSLKTVLTCCPCTPRF
jgi:hypothetical protein